MATQEPEVKKEPVVTNKDPEIPLAKAIQEDPKTPEKSTEVPMAKVVQESNDQPKKPVEKEQPPPKKVPVPPGSLPSEQNAGLFGNPFFRTTLQYWDGSAHLNYTWYWILTVFLGWTGLDLLYLRSPLGAIGKLFLNAITFGYWWFYDAMEATFNKDQVQVAGPSMPFYGPMGIAGGMFTPSSSNGSKHYYFIVYGIVLLITGLLGGDSFLVGDNMSGYIRFFSLISFVFSPIAILWWIYKLYQFFIRPDQLLDQNYPFFGAPEPRDLDQICPNVLEVATVWTLDTTRAVLQYIPILNNFVPFLDGLIEALKVSYGMTKTIVETAVTLAQQGPDVLDSMTDVIKLNKPEADATVKVAQSGGGKSAIGSILLIASLAFVMISSLSMNVWRTIQNKWNGLKAETGESNNQRSDDPPHPRTSGRSSSR